MGTRRGPTSNRSTRRTCRCSPRCCWVIAGRREAAALDGRRSDLARPARGAADRARPRPVPAHRGVPLRPRRPQQPGRARPRRARRARRAGVDAGRPRGVGRDRIATARAVLVSGCSPSVAGSTSPATSRSMPARSRGVRPHGRGRRSRARHRRPHGDVRPPAPSSSPPGRWRHVLLDDEPEAEGALHVNAALPPSPRSSFADPDPLACRVFRAGATRTKHSDAASSPPGWDLCRPPAGQPPRSKRPANLGAILASTRRESRPRSQRWRALRAQNGRWRRQAASPSGTCSSATGIRPSHDALGTYGRCRRAAKHWMTSAGEEDGGGAGEGEGAVVDDDVVPSPPHWR